MKGNNGSAFITGLDKSVTLNLSNMKHYKSS